jgi:hypothetical protein
MSSKDDQVGGGNPEHHLERLIKQFFEDHVKYSEELHEDERAVIISLFGVLMNRGKILKHQQEIGAPDEFVKSYELVVSP